jgi:hypothetical protein
MTDANLFAAVDLGASSGRVMTARIGDGLLDLTEVHRFPNQPVRDGGTLHWDTAWSPTQHLRRYGPRGDDTAWAEAAGRVGLV